MSANSHFHSTHESHYQCAVCSSIDANPNSLAVNYQCLADGSVVGEFHVLPRHQVTPTCCMVALRVRCSMVQ